jgi:hypothetical protein
MKVVPLHLREANEYVKKWHRHLKPIRVAKWSIGAVDRDEITGVAICMRPAVRALDDGKTIEVCRGAVDPDLEKHEKDGVQHANAVCSMLYGACARVATEMGYVKIQTYTLDEEPGTTMRAAGWTLEKEHCGGVPRGTRRGKDVSHIWDATTLKFKKRWARILKPTEYKPRKPGWDVLEVVQDSQGIWLRVPK